MMIQITVWDVNHNVWVNYLLGERLGSPSAFLVVILTLICLFYL